MVNNNDDAATLANIVKKFFAQKSLTQIWHFEVSADLKTRLNLKEEKDFKDWIMDQVVPKVVRRKKAEYGLTSREQFLPKLLDLAVCEECPYVTLVKYPSAQHVGGTAYGLHFADFGNCAKLLKQKSDEVLCRKLAKCKVVRISSSTPCPKANWIFEDERLIQVAKRVLAEQKQQQEEEEHHEPCLAMDISDDDPPCTPTSASAKTEPEAAPMVSPDPPQEHEEVAGKENSERVSSSTISSDLLDDLVEYLMNTEDMELDETLLLATPAEHETTLPFAAAEPQQKARGLLRLASIVSVRRVRRKAVSNVHGMVCDNNHCQSQPASADHKQVVIQGYLHKLGRNGVWQRRFFEVDGATLTYYKNNRRRRALASLDLSTVGEISGVENDKTGKTFTIEVAERLYNLRADRDETCKDWINNLHKMKEGEEEKQEEEADPWRNPSKVKSSTAELARWKKHPRRTASLSDMRASLAQRWWSFRHRSGNQAQQLCDNKHNQLENGEGHRENGEGHRENGDGQWENGEYRNEGQNAKDEHRLTPTNSVGEAQ